MEQKTQSARDADAGRISVLRDGQMVPLLPNTQAATVQRQPWNGILLERHAVEPGEVPTHEHPELCLHLQLSGEGGFEWWSERHNSTVQSQTGSLILIAPGTTDRLRWQDSSERLLLSIQTDWLRSFADQLNAKLPVDFKTLWDFHDASVQYLIAEMGREANHGWPLGHLYADLLANNMASLLLRRYSMEQVETPAAKGGLTLSQLRRTMEFIHQHLSDDLRLEQIANELDLSSFHFAHQFRSSTGQTPYQYLLDLRMARARELLKTTGFSVQSIAVLAGFRSPVNFVRTFRERIGTTPGEWRKNA